MEFPADLKYTKDHEWVRVEGDTAIVGITDYAQNALGDVVFAELPKVGQDLEKGKGAAVVESVKSVSDVYAPIAGKVTAVNDKVSADPSILNKSPYKDGWMFKVKLKDKGELSSLMDSKKYSEFASQQHH